MTFEIKKYLVKPTNGPKNEPRETDSNQKRFCLDVVDSMDLDTLEIVYDQLIGSYDNYDEKDMMFEISDHYNDEGQEYNNLLEEVNQLNINVAGTTI